MCECILIIAVYIQAYARISNCQQYIYINTHI